jgi:hypothetical protein
VIKKRGAAVTWSAYAVADAPPSVENSFFLSLPTCRRHSFELGCTHWR